MTFNLRRIVWHEEITSRNDDFSVIDGDGVGIGRIYRRNTVEESWYWSIYGVDGWLADTREDAISQFKAKYTTLTGPEAEKARRHKLASLNSAAARTRAKCAATVR